MSTDTMPGVFTVKDTAMAVELTGLPSRCGADDIEAALNIDLRTYLVAARRERAGTPAEFEAWCESVRKATDAFLAALGLEPSTGNGSVPIDSFSALCSRHGELTTRLSAVAKPYEAVDATVQGVWLLQSIATSAAAHYRGQKKPGRPAGIGSRKVLMVALGKTFARVFGRKAPSYPSPGQSPFLRFALWFCQTAGRRELQVAITWPDDGRDVAAMKALRFASEAALADDLRSIADIVKARAAGKSVTRKRGKTPG